MCIPRTHATRRRKHQAHATLGGSANHGALTSNNTYNIDNVNSMNNMNDIMILIILIITLMIVTLRRRRRRRRQRRNPNNGACVLNARLLFFGSGAWVKKFWLWGMGKEVLALGHG